MNNSKFRVSLYLNSKKAMDSTDILTSRIFQKILDGPEKLKIFSVSAKRGDDLLGTLGSYELKGGLLLSTK